MFKNILRYKLKSVLVPIFITTFLVSSILVFGSARKVEATQEGISVAPAEFDPNNSLTKRWFIEKIQPGQTVQRTANVINLTSTDKTIKITARDRQINPDGSFSFVNEEQDNKLVGNWIKLESNQVDVPAGKTVSVKFSLTVPADTKPGEYAGVIAVEELAPKGSSSGFNIVSVVGSRVYVTVPGDLSTGVKFNTFEFIQPGSTYYNDYINGTATTENEKVFMSWDLTNIGNVFTKVKGKLTLEAPDGSKEINRDVDLPAFDNGVNLRFVQLDAKLQVGKYKATYTYETKAVIPNNKDGIKNKSETNSITAEMDVTQAMLDEIKSAKDKVRQDQPLPTKASNTNNSSTTFGMMSSEETQKAGAQAQTKDTLVYVLGGVIILLLLAIIGYLVYKEMHKKKDSQSVTPKEAKNQDHQSQD